MNWPGSGTCQVCGHSPCWGDLLTGDTICADCASWALIPRFLHHITAGRGLAVVMNSIAQQLEEVDNELPEAHVTLERVN